MLTKYNGAINTIQSLSDRPNQNEGLTAAQLKLKFDKSAIDMKAYIDDTLTVELDALDAANMKKTGDQTIQGVKTFESSPIVPTPITGNQAANREYVDNSNTGQTNALNTHKSSSDHDERYYTKTELSDSTGATKIGATAIPTLNGDTVQEVLESVKNKFDDIAEINVNVEVANTHTAVNGEVYDTLPDRLDSVDGKLADISINVSIFGAVGDGVTDDTTALRNAINSLTNGGTVIFESGKIYLTDTLNIISGVTLDLNGSELKLKPSVSQYHNLVSVPQTTLVTNIGIMNGKLNGDKVNQSGDYSHGGIYFINVDGVKIHNLEIINCDGEGLFLGYTGYLATNVDIKNLKLSGSTRNDIAITNALNVFADNVVINSLAFNSASVDLELQSATDILKNIYLNNFVINSNVQPMKLLINGHLDNTENVTLSNFKFTGSKGLQITNFDNVTLNNTESSAPIELVGSQNIIIDEMKCKNVTGNGLFIYNSIAPNLVRDSFDIKINNSSFTNNTNYGVALQQVNSVMINNCVMNDNSASGLFLTGVCQNVSVSNSLMNDNRAIASKTQLYGIKFDSVCKNISFVGCNFRGNKNGEYTGVTIHPQVKSTSNDIIYYLDGTNGNDGNDGINSGTGAFKTWARLEQAIPQIVNHTITVNIASFNYSGVFILNGRHGKGSITFVGAATKDYTRSFQYISISNCSCKIKLQGIAWQVADNVGSINRCTFIEIDQCIFDASNKSGYGILINEGSNVYLSNSRALNANKGLYVRKAKLITYAIDGGNNDNGYYIEEGGILQRMDATKPTGTSDVVQTGSLVVHASGGAIGS